MNIFRRFVKWLSSDNDPGRDRGTHWTRTLWMMGHDSLAKRDDLNAYLNDLKDLAFRIEKEQGNTRNALYYIIMKELKYWEVHRK